MGILSWDKPARKMPVEEWQAISADSAPPGVYTPNMSDEDMALWKAKKIAGKDPRVEIRKSVQGSQVLIVVRPLIGSESCCLNCGEPIRLVGDAWIGDVRPSCTYRREHKTGVGTVRVSMNGPAVFAPHEFRELPVAVAEARLALTTHSGPPPRLSG